MTDADDKYMDAALKLARRGVGQIEPNPAVGCVIVKQNQIIGKGWHKKFGSPHAEINAIEDCKNLGASPAGATMYVTFEPCCHRGKTGPCTDAIIAARLAKVVVAMVDPSEHACGKGIEQLRSAGIEVRTGICEKQAQLLNAPFVKFAKTGKPWVILKWAQTIDGKLAYCQVTADKRWISNELSRKDVQNLRRRVQGLLTGVNTILADDPLLTARPSRGQGPIRIVLDSNLTIPLDCKVLKTIKKAPVLIFTTDAAIEANQPKVEDIEGTGAEIVSVPTENGRCDITKVLDDLGRRGVQQLLVESGPQVISSFLAERLVDEVFIYIAPTILGSQGSVDIGEAMAQLTETVGLYHVELKSFGDDTRIRGLTKTGIEA